MKHQIQETRGIRKTLRNLHRDYLEVLASKIRNLADNPYVGKPSHAPYKGLREVKIGKYRLIYSIPGYCQVRLERIIHRETL